MLKVRQIDLDADHATFAKWWELHGWPVLPKAALSTLGIVVELVGQDGEKEPIVAGWIYMASTNAMAMLEWIVSNPAAQPITIARAISVLLEVVSDECKARGCAVVFSAIKQPALGRIFQKAGFQKQDEGMTHFTRIL